MKSYILFFRFIFKNVLYIFERVDICFLQVLFSGAGTCPCQQGRDGRDGQDGRDGKSVTGPPGRDGVDGRDGKDCVECAKGPPVSLLNQNDISCVLAPINKMTSSINMIKHYYNFI